MALIYSTIWEQGDKKEVLSLGYHYKKRVKSLVVPDHQRVTIYENEDRQGKKSMPLYGGTYHHLYFYGISDRPGLIHVEDVGLTALDLVEIGWWAQYGKGKDERYPMFYSLPTGDHKGGEGFPDDRIQWLYIPFGMTVEVFNRDDFQKGSLIFSGNREGEKERVNLWDHKFSDGGNSASWKTSSMKVRADKWVSAGIAIEEENIVGSGDNKTIATIELFNNSPHTATVSKEISAAYEESVEENWNVGGSVAAKAGFEVGPETAKFSGEVEVTVSGGYGESKTSTKQRQITDMASVEINGFGKAKASLIVEEGRMEGIAVRKWRNTRNNVIIEQRGKISAKRANKSQVEIH